MSRDAASIIMEVVTKTPQSRMLLWHKFSPCVPKTSFVNTGA
jgi:hypothetical protein